MAAQACNIVKSIGCWLQDQWLGAESPESESFSQQRAESPKLESSSQPREESSNSKRLSQSRGFTPKFKKCAIHFLPISTAIVLATLNLATFFVGNELTGFDSGLWQDFYHLTLQVAAKLYELLIVASLATILMDVLRRQLCSTHGLPFGFLLAKTSFTDATWLLSPEFFAGIGGFRKSVVKRAVLALFLTTCSLLAVLAGPSAALLLIPQVYSDWNAGSARFNLVGTAESIWPSRLDAQSIGGDHCRAPPNSTLRIDQLSSSSCIWSGYDTIGRWFQTTEKARIHSIPISGGLVERNINYRYYPLSIAAWGVSLAACTYTELLGQVWLDAIMWANTAGGLSKHTNLRFRKAGASVISIDSEIPVARTTCFTNASVRFADVVDKYPLDHKTAQVALGKPYDDKLVLGQQQSFNSTSYVNSSHVAAVWLETPADELIGTNMREGRIVGRSSAYLNIQVPYVNGSVGLLASCSIDARWTRSQVLGMNAGELGPAYYEPALHTLDPIELFPAVSNGTWRTVRLGLDWLNILTPAVTPDRTNPSRENNHETTLSRVIGGSVAAYNITSDQDEAFGYFIAALVSAMVADGMSHSGYQGGGGAANLYNKSAFKRDEFWQPILAKSYVVPTAPSQGQGAYQMRWSILATGYGYKANSTSYYLALTVVFLHVALAVVHIVWVFIDGYPSTAWSSLADLFVLALRSPTPKLTLAGAPTTANKRWEMLKEPVSIDGTIKSQAVMQLGECQGSARVTCGGEPADSGRTAASIDI